MLFYVKLLSKHIPILRIVLQNDFSFENISNNWQGFDNSILQTVRAADKIGGCHIGSKVIMLTKRIKHLSVSDGRGSVLILQLW
jgi:hypothetical protein